MPQQLLWQSQSGTCETLLTQSYALQAFSFCPLLSAGIRLIWLIYWPLTMSDSVKCGGPRLTSDSKHTGVGSVTVVSAGTPCRYLGPVGLRASCSVNPPPPLFSVLFMGGPRRSGLPFLALQELTPGSLNGPRPEVFLAPGPIKREPWKRA